MLVNGVLDAGEDLTLFSYDPPEVLKELFPPRPNFSLVHEQLHWEWNRWYSRHGLMTFVSSALARAASYKRLVRRLVDEHRLNPFDVILQFSQTEIFSLAKHLHKLSPVVLFPCVHAAGELRWHRKESKYALQSESWWRHRIVRSNLWHRSRIQRNALLRVYGQIGMSKRFNELMRQDYGVRAERQAVVYQPISAKPPLAVSSSERIKLVFVGRISVRKGIEQIVELSYRLNDLAKDVEMVVLGGPSFWSDYSKHLQKLNPALASYEGSKPHEQVIATLASSDLLLVPSMYEPGGIVVAEALSQGCRVVASNEVGSAEPLRDDICYRFRAGDMNEFERAVRLGIIDSQNNRNGLRSRAVEEACERFDEQECIHGLLDALRRASRREPMGPT